MLEILSRRTFPFIRRPYGILLHLRLLKYRHVVLLLPAREFVLQIYIPPLFPVILLVYPLFLLDARVQNLTRLPNSYCLTLLKIA